MNIIFISNNMAKAKTLSVLQVSTIVFALVILPVLLTLLLIVPQDTSLQREVQSGIPAKLGFSFNINKTQKNLDAYALQLGELQARMMRLDAQSERLAKLAGEKKEPVQNQLPTKKKVSLEPNKLSAANQGGPLVLSTPFSEPDLQRSIAELTAKVEFNT